MGLTAAETNGRSQETETLYREHGAAVARFCHSLLRDRSEVEDATQQVFLSAHRALLNGSVPREPLPWLLTVARNECYARFRQRAHTPIPASETPETPTADASVHVLQAGELASVWDEIARMPRAQREAFLLREIRGLTYGQLADELSLSAPSVRSLLVRARMRLRRRLGDVAAGLGAAPWAQALIRFFGGEAASPLPAAAKAAAVGVSALALAGGGSLVARHASRAPAHTSPRHQAAARVRRPPAPMAAALPTREAAEGSSDLERSRSGDSGAHAPSSAPSGSDDRSGDLSTTSGDSSSSGSHDGSTETTAVAQPTTDGHDRSSSTSSDSGSTSTSGPDGGTSTSGSTSGPDGGSTTLTTTTSSGSDGGTSTDGGASTDGGSTSGTGG